MGGGRFENRPELVRALVRDAPGVIAWLERMGAMFDKDEEGRMITIHGGGTSRKRMHTARDYTGAEIMRTLRDEILNRGVEYIEFCPALELLLDEKGRAAGAVLFNLETESCHVVRARTVILATGGLGEAALSGLSHQQSLRGHGRRTGDRLPGRRPHRFRRFHPVPSHRGAYPPQLLGLLVTEKVRSLGATPINVRGSNLFTTWRPGTWRLPPLSASAGGGWGSPCLRGRRCGWIRP